MNEALLSSKNMNWCTPQDFFDKLNDEFHFELDAAATDKSAKCKRYFTPETNGLAQPWTVAGGAVFCNPPYGRKLGEWIKKAHDESKNGTTIVLLIPARTDTTYFHDYIYGKSEIRFIRGRLKFTDEDGKPQADSRGKAMPAPFPSMVVIYNGSGSRTQSAGQRKGAKMAKIGLLDVDGHNFPNIPLMKISAYHKQMGDDVEWVMPIQHYDKIYKSKIFSFTPDFEGILQCDELFEGGSGYAIHLENGKEVYEKEKEGVLPKEIECQCPDYSLYPQFSEAYGFCVRGCPRGCPFCIVGKKEGRIARQVADVDDFWKGQKEIKLLDANLLACVDRERILKSLADTKAYVDFTQGLDIRLTEGIVPLINQIKVKRIHFAWDNAKQDLTRYFEEFKKYYKSKDYRRLGVYVLTNFDTTLEEDLYRVYKLRELGFDPYVMIYNKASAPRQIRLLQRYVNNRIIFRTVERFEDYDEKRG